MLHSLSRIRAGTRLLACGSVVALLGVGGQSVMAEVAAHPVFEPPLESPLQAAPNLFLKAKVAASGHWGDRVSTFAVDGKSGEAGAHWACENIPVWLTVELSEARDLNTIRLWTYWGGGRYYQYLIEGSADGQSWATLVDQRANTIPASEVGETFHFPTQQVRQVRVTFTHNSAGNASGGHIVEIEGYTLGAEQLAKLDEQDACWRKVPDGLQGGFGSVDVRYARSEPPPDAGPATWSGVAWRGERASAQLLFWSRTTARRLRLACSALRSKAGDEIPATGVRTNFVRYVKADKQVVSDVLDSAACLDLLARSVRPVWLSIDVPATAKPGLYQGQVEARADGGVVLRFEVNLEVLPAVLPPPADWTFRLDLWQNPYAVARYHRVQPWSEAHWRVLEPHLRLLAGAGQKCITATLIHRPWGTQTYDPYDSMVKWTRRADGTWTYDYTDFDRYVEFAMRCGITGSINCYSMLPWGGFAYTDEATGDVLSVSAAPGSARYEEHWQPFLLDFVAHLRQKGWLGKTYIAMDERPIEVMTPAVAFLRKVAPELKIALAGTNHPELDAMVDDWCAFIPPPLDPAIARARTQRGLETTFYVCCGPGVPNTFTASPPAESAWLGWYAAAQGYGGFLRWAYDSWGEDPLLDTSYVTWTAGDCFLVYPDGRSSIRFERLREGIQDYEKIRLVRAALGKRDSQDAKACLARLDEALARFTYTAVQKEPAVEPVRLGKAALEDATRRAFPR